MGNFQAGKHGGFKGGKPAYNKGSSYGNGRGGYRPNPVVVMHKATCAQCGKPCEVPFRPNGEKPVYCRDCFAGGDKGGERNDRGGDRGDRPARREFTDRNDRPSYSSGPRPEFANSPAAPSHDSMGELKRHLVDIGNKLDRVISALEKSTTAPLVEEAPKGPSLKAIVKKVVSKKKTK